MAYKFSEEFLNESLSYSSYRTLIDNLLSEGKTTGENQEQELVEDTKLNIQRMNRNDKTAAIEKELKGLVKAEQHWILISQAWCGDAANTVPVIAKMADYAEKVNLHIILRDDNADVMNEYLTNGARSTPMLIVLDNNYNELFVWGPRPKELENFVYEFKKQDNFVKEELKNNVQMWYLKDKSLSTQKEIINLLKEKNSNDNTQT